MKLFTAIKQTCPFVLALLAAFIVAQLSAGFMRSLETRVGDKIWQWVATVSETEQRVVIVDIDESSIARYGAWPWPRERVAKLSSQIAKQGASLQIFDMLFVAEKQGDDQLVSQFKSQQTVLAQILAIDADDKTQAGVLSAGEENIGCNTLYPKANAYIANNKKITAAVPAIGHITPTIDKDGVVRRMPAYICRQQKAYPALALSALASAIGGSSGYQLHESNAWLAPKRQLRHAQLPEITIPLGEQGEILLPWWLSRNALVSISAMELLEGNASRAMLEGAWVLIGSTAFGVGDSVATPQAGVVGGVEVHAQLLSALLDNKLPYQPQGSGLVLYLWMAVVSLILLLFGRLKGRLVIYGAPVVGLLLAVITLVMQAVILKTQHMWLPSMLVVIYALLAGVFITVQGYAQSWVENQRLYLNLTSYLPEHAAKWIAKQEPINSMEAHHEMAFVMYIDLRNFSNWCNQLQAEQVGAILHAFYKVVTEVVEKHGGQTEKYVGDAVMCVWRKRDKSILAAANQLISLIEEQFGEESKQNELPPLAVGIGIEYGQILVGSLGPAQRREYTVIGRAVTTAIQLQEMTTELALPVLIGQGAAQKWADEVCLETQGKFLLPHAQVAMEIYTPK